MSFDYDPEGDAPPLSQPAADVRVYRYTPDADDDAPPDDKASKKYELIPNVQCVEIQEREGLEPATARFEYVTDDRAIVQGWPSEYEQIMAIAYKSDASPKPSEQPSQKGKPDFKKYVVKPDDRIVVKLTDREGVTEVLFDGFSQSPQLDVTGKQQSITFVAVSVACRLFTSPVLDRRQAWSGLAAGFSPSKEHYQRVMQVPARFNPDGKANCTPESLWYDDDGDPESDSAYPLFYEFGASPYEPVKWSLAMACAYIFSYYLDEDARKFVDPPDLGILTDLLNRRMPKDQKPDEPPDPNLFYDPEDEETYKEEPIVLRDFDASGMLWPDAIERLLSFGGFAARFVVEADEKGDPWTYIEVYRKDNGGPTDPKTVDSQARFSAIDVARTNVKSISVVRDYKNAYNAVAMDAYPALVEVSVVLAMKGPAHVGDETNWALFSSQKDTGFDSQPSAYRIWYADELGEGHLSADGSGQAEDACDFAPAFEPFKDFGDGKELLRKFRPGRRTIISKDDKGKAKDASLWYSRDYAGPVAALWDKTGEWHRIPHGWTLLKDRLGIHLEADNLEDWKLGLTDEDASTTTIIRLITAMANPSGANTRIFMRLDTVIEADVRGFKDFEGRKASILKWDRYRYLNGKGTFQRQVVHESSPNFTAPPFGAPLASADLDTSTDAYSWMSQAQQASENPAFAGSIVIPWYTAAYKIGDRISKIAGRDLSLQVNQGAGQGEAPVYPAVVGRSLRFGDAEETHLQLSDFRAMPDDPRSKRK